MRTNPTLSEVSDPLQPPGSHQAFSGTWGHQQLPESPDDPLLLEMWLQSTPLGQGRKDPNKVAAGAVAGVLSPATPVPGLVPVPPAYTQMPTCRQLHHRSAEPGPLPGRGIKQSGEPSPCLTCPWSRATPVRLDASACARCLPSPSSPVTSSPDGWIPSHSTPQGTAYVSLI